jgi:DNA-binding transcriptional MerR regulator
MSYTIGQISDETSLSIHTLRYYEKEGIMPPIKRTEGGNRIYEQDDLELLKFICCLKATGMSIVDLKEFASLIRKGHQSIDQRIHMLQKQKEHVYSQIEELHSYLKKIEDKINYYQKVIDEK